MPKKVGGQGGGQCGRALGDGNRPRYKIFSVLCSALLANGGKRFGVTNKNDSQVENQSPITIDQVANESGREKDDPQDDRGS